jgi:hypothetical protein
MPALTRSTAHNSRERVTRACHALALDVNDAVIGFPGLYDLFYRNNCGAADLLVTRRECGPAWRNAGR